MRDYLLIRKIKAGDTAAWDELVAQYYQIIFSYCYRRCYGKRQLAEDLTQETFLKLVKNLQHFQFTGKFFNYLFTIAVNTCNNYFAKKQFYLSELHENLPAENQSAAAELVEQETASEVQAALNQLPDIQREALILKYFYELKVKEIAKITGTTVPTAQSRIQQGLKKLQKYIDKEALDVE